MRLAVISDLHLGKRQYRTEEGAMNKFERAGYTAFNKNIEIILNENPDLVIICGDIFETANPSILALEKFREGLNKLKDLPMLIILGNHDFNFNNRRHDCSSVKALISEEHNIKKFADYNVEFYIQDNILFVLAPYVFDKLEILQNIWKQCFDLTKEYKDYHKIFITHGMTETYAKQHPEFGDKYVIPNTLVKQFDEVFIGHIHTPFEMKEGKTLIVSPGAIIDYQAYKLGTGPVIYDTNAKKLRRILVDTPYIHKKTLNEKTINRYLSNIGPYIYNLTYDGDISAIDNSLFIEAKQKSINLVLNLVQHEVEETELVHNTNFYSWIAENYQDKIEIFNEARHAIKLEQEN